MKYFNNILRFAAVTLLLIIQIVGLVNEITIEKEIHALVLTIFVYIITSDRI